MQQELKPKIREVSFQQQPNIERIIGQDINQAQVTQQVTQAQVTQQAPDEQQPQIENKYANYGFNLDDIINQTNNRYYQQANQQNIPQVQQVINKGGLLVTDTPSSDNSSWKYLTYLLPILAIFVK